MKTERTLRTACCMLLALAGAVGVLSGCGGRSEPESYATITIDSAPEQGASVLMYGVEHGETPVTITDVAPGEYEVVLRLDRYRRKFEEISVTKEPEQSFVVEMEPITGTLTITSSPEGAEVLLDGEVIGETPIYRHVLQVGEYSYTVNHPHAYPVENTFTLEDGFNMEFSHQLRAMEAELHVHSRPSSADIWLNNIRQGERTPATFRLRPGKYLVSVHTDGHLQGDELVELAANDSETVQMTLPPGKVPQGMVLVPAGEFIMGSDERAPDERPERRIHLDAFYIDRFEVTNQAFKRVFRSHDYPDGHDNYPALGVSWTQAVRYCEAVGKRLPTEAEREKAARGTDGREYPWGEVFEPGMANTAESGIGRATRVGSYFASASPYGCMDMAGNAYEWTADWYEAYPGNRDVTKDYGQIFRVLRGGSFRSDKFDVRCAARHFDRMDAKRSDYGFRCAMNARE